jgi:hypothetical protein
MTVVVSVVRPILADEDVRRLDVAVHDQVRVRMLETGG